MNPPPDTPRRSAGIWLGWIALILIGMGLVGHLMLRDAWPFPWCTAYYALPRPILLIAAVVVWLTSRISAPLLGSMAAGTSLLLLGWIIGTDFSWNWYSSTPGGKSICRIATWNAGHLPHGRTLAARTIASWNADLIGIVEAGPCDAQALSEWRTELPGYVVESPGNGLLWIARKTITLNPAVTLSPRSEVALARVWISGHPLDAVLVSLTSNPAQTRRKPQAELVAYLESLTQSPVIAGSPVVVMGDFNTPAESVWWKDLRRTWRCAFETAGYGYRPTWPSYCPVLELDYILVSPQSQVLRCWHEWSWASDHQPVLAEITIPD